MDGASPDSRSQSNRRALSDIRGERASGLRERIIEGGLFACAAASVLTTLGIVVVLFMEAIPFFFDVSLLEFFGSTQWTPLYADANFGVWPLVGGTLLVTVIAISVALPFGLLAAIYLSEYASERARKIFKPMLEILAGVPTIVYGYFALVFVTPLLQQVIPGMGGFNALSPGIVMGIMIIPMISSLSEDALHAVPDRLRESSYALGINRIQTIWYVTLPAARSGIVAATTLAVSRAIGETMIVAIAAGQMANLTMDPRESVQTMTAYIVQLSTGDVPTGSLEYQTLFAVGALLFLMTFAMNVIGQWFARKVRNQ